MTSADMLELTANNPFVWGIAARGANLVIDEAPSELAGTWVIDVENNLDKSCAGLGLTQDGSTIYFFTPEYLKTRSSDYFAQAQLVGHNIKYDVQMMRLWGFNVTPDQIVWDTQLAEYVRDSTRFKYGLKALLKDYFGFEYPDYKALTGKGKKAVSIGTLPVDTVANYNGCDVLGTHKLYTKQRAEFTPAQISYLTDIELPTMRVILEMEARGVKIDAAHVRELDALFRAESGKVLAQIRADTKSNVNLNSPKQVAQLLLETCRLNLPTTAADELKKHLKYPIVQKILRYREVTKLASTYTSVLGNATGSQYRLNARFNQTVTQTGRLSGSEPNLQNIPTRTSEGNQIRGGFIAEVGYEFVDADYSQIEPRLMAHLSQDPLLLKIFRSGSDLYDGISEAVGLPVNPDSRKISKILFLAMAYNAGAFKIGQVANISTYKAQQFLAKMKLAFAQFFYWRDKVMKQAEIDGGVRTLMGRFIPLDIDAAHLAPNYTVQGSAAEIMKLAIIQTRDFWPVMTVHDELVFEVPAPASERIARQVKAIMEGVAELTVPLIVEVGTGATWAEAKK